MNLNGVDYVAVQAPTARGGPLHPSLPTRPGFDLVPKDEVGRKLTKAEQAAESMKTGLANMQGSNEDIVNNRRAIRMANQDAAARLKAELAGVPYVEPVAAEAEPTVELERTDEEEKVELPANEAKGALDAQGEADGADEEIVPPVLEAEEPIDEAEDPEIDESDAPSRMSPVPLPAPGAGRGTKRARMEADDVLEDPPNPDADQPISKKKKLKFNSDGTVEGYVDDVRLWEPGYRERYYENKFGVMVTDREFINE